MHRIQLVNKFLFTLFLLAILSACQDPKENSAARLQYGISLFEEGKYDLAQLELRSAIQQDKSNAEAYYYLALIDEKNANYKQMQRRLLEAVKLNPENINARLKLSMLYLIANKTATALSEIEGILTISAGNQKAKILQAAVLLKQNKQKEALKIIDAVLQQAPGNSDAVVLKATILMNNKDYDNALSFIEPALVESADSLALHMLKINLHYKTDNTELLVSDYQNLVTTFADNDEFKYKLAKLYVQQNQREAAEKLLLNIVHTNSKDIKPKIVLLDLMHSYNNKRTKILLNQYISDYHDQPEVLLQIAKWALLRNFPDKATEFLKVLVSDEDEKLEYRQQALLLLANVAFSQQDFAGAKQSIENNLELNSDYLPARIFQAKILVVEEQYDQARGLLNKTLLTNPKSDAALVMLAQIHLLMGEPEKADKRFREALEIFAANLDALFPVVKRALQKGEIDHASNLVSHALKYKPRDQRLLSEMALINLIKQDWQGMEKIINVLERNPDNQSLAMLLKGKMKKGQNNCAQAIIVFTTLLDKNPDQNEALYEMARCYYSLQQNKEMLNYLEDYIIKHPNNIFAINLKAKIYLQNKNYIEAASLLKIALKEKDKALELYLTLADVYRLQGKKEKIINIYQRGLEEIPGNLRISLNLASAYEDLGENDKALVVYEKILAERPNLQVVKNNLASLLVNGFADEESINRARQLVKSQKNSDNPYLLDTYAWVELRLGNIIEALPLLEKVNIMEPDAAIFKYHLGVAYQKQGNKAGSVAQLLQAIELGMVQNDFVELQAAQELLAKIQSTND